MLIEFVQDWFAEVESYPGRLRQVAFKKGQKMRADVRPLAIEHKHAPSANLHLENGTIALNVPLSSFS